MKIKKYLVTVCAFCFVMAIGTTTVHADTYSIGDVSITGNIDNNTYSPGGAITVTGQISNSNPYSAIPAYLSASTNGVTKNVVSSQTIAAGSSTSFYYQNFNAPSSPGSYSVAFDAGANLPAAQQVVGFNLSVTSASGSCGVNQTDGCVAASITLDSPLTQSVSFGISDEYWDSGVNGPSSVGFEIIIPAGQTDGYAAQVIRPDTSNGSTYLSSGGNWTTVNGVTTNDLLAGTLLTAYTNTKLQLVYSSVGYGFSCSNQQHPDIMMCN